MDPALSVGAAFLGFALTFFVWNRVALWGYAIWTARTAPESEAKTSVALPVLLVASSTPWLLVAYVGFCYYVFANPHKPEWSWFWAGAGAVPPLILLLVLAVLRRRRKGANEGSAATAKNGSKDAV